MIELLTTVNCRKGHMNACEASIFGDNDERCVLATSGRFEPNPSALYSTALERSTTISTIHNEDRHVLQKQPVSFSQSRIHFFTTYPNESTNVF